MKTQIRICLTVEFNCISSFSYLYVRRIPEATSEMADGTTHVSSWLAVRRCCGAKVLPRGVQGTGGGHEPYRQLDQILLCARGIQHSGFATCLSDARFGPSEGAIGNNDCNLRKNGNRSRLKRLPGESQLAQRAFRPQPLRQLQRRSIAWGHGGMRRKTSQRQQ